VVPCRCFPPGVACGAEGEVAVSDSTTSGAAPTSPPEGVFRRTRRWKYRRAVGTHYGPTRIHQADYSPRHRRDGRAGTTILLSSPHLPPGRAASRSDYGPDGAVGVWGNAVVSAGAAGPFRDYGPGRSRRRRRRRRRGRSTFQGLRAGWSGGRTKPEYPATSGRHDHATFRGAGRRVSPMYGTRSQQHVRRGTGRVTYRFMR
jgi:hypothetical protein